MSLKYEPASEPLHIVGLAPAPSTSRALSLATRSTPCSQFKDNHFTEICCGTSYLRRIDSCITQLKAQGPPRTFNESKEEEEDYPCAIDPARAVSGYPVSSPSLLLSSLELSDTQSL